MLKDKKKYAATGGLIKYTIVCRHSIENIENHIHITSGHSNIHI